MSVVTLSRQMGSLGDEIAQLLANHLGYSLVDRELINQAAARIGSPELALAMVDELGLLGVCTTDDLCAQYVQTVTAVIQEYALKDRVVFLGRGSQVVLKGIPDIIHISVIAPIEIRKARISGQQNISLEAAANQIKAGDRNRQNYLKRFYQARWNDPDWYDLVINTGSISVEKCVEIISRLL